MAHLDLREFLLALEQATELHHIDAEVSPQLELGAVAQRLAESGGPAVHFRKVTGAAAGVSHVAGLLGRGRVGLWSRVAIALGLSAEAGYREVRDEIVRRCESPIRPIEVNGGQCKQVIVQKDKIDLESLAAPLLHEGDGGRCLTSWAFTIAADPDSGYVAWDLLPLYVHSRTELAGRIPADSNVGHLWRTKYAAKGKPMPFAIVFGGPPLVTMAAAFRRRRGGMTSAELAGSMQRSPVQLVKCESSDLLVPSGAELVLEGLVSPDKQVKTGAIAGAFGYRVKGPHVGPVFEVHTITHRRDPILPVCAWGTPTSDIHIVQGLDRDAQLKARLEKTGAPVVDVFSPPWLAGSVVAASTKVPYSAYAQTVSGIIRSIEGTKYTPYVLVCDDDIDITNPVSLFHALVTKCHPSRDSWIVKESIADPDAPYLSDEERAAGIGARAIFDCTWPLDWDKSIAVPPKVSFDQCYPKALQEKVLQEWSATLGFPREIDRPARV